MLGKEKNKIVKIFGFSLSIGIAKMSVFKTLGEQSNRYK